MRTKKQTQQKKKDTNKTTKTLRSKITAGAFCTLALGGGASFLKLASTGNTVSTNPSSNIITPIVALIGISLIFCSLVLVRYIIQD